MENSDNTNKKISIVNDIREINNTIAKYAVNSEWDKVENSTLERHQLVKHFCESNASILSEALLTNIQSEIELSDNHINIIINKNKSSTIQSTLALKNSYKAANEYRKTHNETFIN